MRLDADVPQPNANAWKTFLDLLDQVEPNLAALDALLPALERTDRLEEALAECRKRHRDRTVQRLWKPFRDRLEHLGAQARTRRAAQWQFDPNRRTLHLKLALAPPFTLQNPMQRVHALAESFKAGDLSVALGLEKHPRPLIGFAHALPIGLEGRAEWADVILKAPPPIPPSQLPHQLATHLPQGVSLLEARRVPNHATPLSDRCTGAHWMWPVPPALRSLAHERLAAFWAASHWTITKTGKVEGHKTLKAVDVRDRVLDLTWEGETLHVHLRHDPGEALNPIKLLSGILEVDPAQVTGLVRLSLTLRDDPRLEAMDRYAPKLHNIWEDAVLLESNDDFDDVDDGEDDEPLRLG